MLVLARRPGESIHVHCEGANGTRQTMVIRVHEVRSGHVRLAFDAPDEVKIMRSEIDATLEPTPSRSHCGRASPCGPCRR